MAMAGRSAARRRRPENLGNMCKSARASGTEESLGLESGLRQFKNPTKIEIFGNGELPMQKLWNQREEWWKSGFEGCLSACASVSARKPNSIDSGAVDSYAKGYGSWLRAEG